MLVEFRNVDAPQMINCSRKNLLGLEHQQYLLPTRMISEIRPFGYVSSQSFRFSSF